MSASPTEETRASLALSLVPSVGPVLFERLIKHIGSPSAVLAEGKERLSRIPGIGPKTAAAIAAFDGWALVERQLEETRKLGARLICLGDPDYPASLANIPAPPPVLFVQGNLESINTSSISIVGTRHPDAYGRRASREFAAFFAAHGLPVVSGFAVGIDQEAHAAAIEAGGRTWAVLGCGLDVDYPKGSGKLREKILGQGAMISEFPPGTPPAPANFRQRNRLISGLAKAVVLIQGTRQSGAMITVSHALEQNRDVFCLPGPIYSERSEAPHYYLKQGATIAASPEDVLEALSIPVDAPRASPATIKTGHPSMVPIPPVESGLSEEEQLLIGVLDPRTGLHRDEILSRAGLDASRAAPILLRLELKGLLRAQPGGIYTRN